MDTNTKAVLDRLRGWYDHDYEDPEVDDYPEYVICKNCHNLKLYIETRLMDIHCSDLIESRNYRGNVTSGSVLLSNNGPQVFPITY